MTPDVKPVHRAVRFCKVLVDGVPCGDRIEVTHELSGDRVRQKCVALKTEMYADTALCLHYDEEHGT